MHARDLEPVEKPPNPRRGFLVALFLALWLLSWQPTF